MALSINDARPIEREITLKSNVRGFEDRAFVVSVGPNGITVREKNRTARRACTWRDLLSYLCLHAPESED